MITAQPKHIMLGLSGGVDSSVAAYLLKKAGHHVEAVFMKNWEGDDTDTYCPATRDIEDAKSVADQLNIPFTTINFANEYWERVFAYFLAEYRAGRTPNPDILCNKEIKFSAFLNYAKQRGAELIATGHYAQSAMEGKQTRLLKGSDPDKDQSYFLHALDETQLAASIFPIGHLPKKKVRDIAKNLGLKTHAKKDGTGICFIGERKFKTFLNEYLPASPGNIETLEGEIIGQHDGLMFHTLGQRQGLQIGGKKGKAELPWYVVNKDVKRNILVVAQGENHPALFKSILSVREVHWINRTPVFPARLTAKIRYRQADQACLVKAHADGSVLVTFKQPQRAMTPGQSVVFYQEDWCLGGGVIS